VPNPLTPISDQEMYGFLGDRDSVTYRDTPIHIDARILNLALDSSTFSRPNHGVYRVPIHFKECTFKNAVKLSRPSITGEFVFEDCTFEDDFSSDFLFSDSIQGKSTFKKDCSLSCNGGKLSVKDLSVTGTLHLNSSGDLLELININVEKKVQDQKIILRSTSNEVKLENIFCADMKVLSLSGRLNSILKLTCNNITLNGPWNSTILKLDRLIADKIAIQNISNSQNEIIVSNNSKIGSLKIPLNKLTRFEISDSDAEKLNLIGKNENSNSIIIKNVQNIKELNFVDVINEGSITLWNLTLQKGSQIGIYSSDLGKAKFIKCEFTKAEFCFENSQVTEIFLSETDFPTVVHLKGIINHAQSQLAFGQLTTAFTKQGDTVRSLAYQAQEIEAHYRHINWRSQDFFKKLSLFLNKYSNNFGRYWFWGLLFSFGAGAMFFFLILIFAHGYHFSFNYNEDYFEAFLKFMNPLRFFDTDALFNFRDKRNRLTLNGSSYVFDFLGRIFVAYGYYQTIQAFRRFGRR
jgi:hypothetical protein